MEEVFSVALRSAIAFIAVWVSFVVSLTLSARLSVVVARQLFWGVLVLPAVFFAAYAAGFWGGWWLFAPVGFGCLWAVAIQVDSGHENQFWPFDG